MNEGQQQGGDNQELEAIVASDELLDLLRSGNEFSVDQHGGLDTVLENLREGLEVFVGMFTGEEITMELSGVALYTGEEQFSSLGAGAGFVNFHDKLGELQIGVGLGVPAFRRILRSLLGAPHNPETERKTPTLSRAEHILFQRFSIRLYRAFIKTLELKPVDFDVVDTDFAVLDKLIAQQELIVLSYVLSFSEGSFPISIITTLDLLEPLYTGDHGITAGDSGLDQAANWKNRMVRKVDEVEIPLFAQLASKSMDLMDVAKLEIGTKLEVEFQLKDVCLMDADNNQLFVADVEIHESEVVLSVNGGPANS